MTLYTRDSLIHVKSSLKQPLSSTEIIYDTFQYDASRLRPIPRKRNSSKPVAMTATPRVLLITFLLSLATGCASVGPSVITTYDDVSERSQVAILRVEQKMGLTVTACDGLSVPRSARYILLKPGRHEVWFQIFGQTLLETYTMTNKKYLDAEAGHTYILKSKGGGLFVVGDKWFPEVIDVTDDAKLHVLTLPQEIIKH